MSEQPVPFPFQSAPNVDAMNGTDDDTRHERRSGQDRRQPSAWANPMLYVGIMGLIITIGMGILGYIAAQLQSIQATVAGTRDTVLTVTARQAEELNSLRDRVAKLENFQSTQTQAYNFNFTTRLAVVEAKAGVKPPNKNSED